MDISFGDWSNITYGIPQGSILGLLLVKIFINDMLFFASKSNICNLVDTQYAPVENF